MNGLPEVAAPCDSPECDKEINLLEPHLTVQVKPVRQVLLSDVVPASGDNPIPQHRLYAGTQSGRGVLLKFCTFDCAEDWFYSRKDLQPILQPHHEDEVYVPEDNRSPEELVEAGELPQEYLHLQAALEDRETVLPEVIRAPEGGEQ